MFPFYFGFSLTSSTNQLFCFFNFPKEVKIWWLVETSLFSKTHFKVRHYEFQINLSACEVIWREMCYNHALPLTNPHSSRPTSVEIGKYQQESHRPGITFQQFFSSYVSFPACYQRHMCHPHHQPTYHCCFKLLLELLTQNIVSVDSSNQLACLTGNSMVYVCLRGQWELCLVSQPPESDRWIELYNHQRKRVICCLHKPSCGAEPTAFCLILEMTARSLPTVKL